MADSLFGFPVKPVDQIPGTTDEPIVFGALGDAPGTITPTPRAPRVERWCVVRPDGSIAFTHYTEEKADAFRPSSLDVPAEFMRLVRMVELRPGDLLLDAAQRDAAVDEAAKAITILAASKAFSGKSYSAHDIAAACYDAITRLAPEVR